MQNTVEAQLAPYTVAGTLGFEELALTIVANQLNPTIVQVDFLKISGIIPTDWQTKKQPVLTAGMSQILFQNGVNIVSQARNITFNQAINAQNRDVLFTPELARNFVERLPNADYQSIALNPKILVAFSQGQDTARRVITEKLLSPGPWSNLGVAPVQAAVNFFYHLDRCKLLLNINEAQIRQGENSPLMSALIFSGTFNYEMASYPAEERLPQLKQRLENWSTDLEEFRKIVNNTFLGQQESVFPVG